MRNLTATLIAAAILAVGSPAQARDEPYFRTGSDGSPVSTLVGEWVTSTEGRAAHLEIKGGHVLGDRSWFEAGWKTPWTTRGEQASFEMTYDFSAANAGKRIALTSRFRYKERGGSWSSWHRHPHPPYEGTVSFWGGGTFFGSTGNPLRFDWKMSGVVYDPEALTGSIDVSTTSRSDEGVLSG